MSKRKVLFRLQKVENGNIVESKGDTIAIIGKRPESKPYVSIVTGNMVTHFIGDKDLERFAVNILKALNSKHLNPQQ